MVRAKGLEGDTVWHDRDSRLVERDPATYQGGRRVRREHDPAGAPEPDAHYLFEDTQPSSVVESPIIDVQVSKRDDSWDATQCRGYVPDAIKQIEPPSSKN
jgi:hypothetical protein